MRLWKNDGITITKEQPQNVLLIDVVLEEGENPAELYDEIIQQAADILPWKFHVSGMSLDICRRISGWRATVRVVVDPSDW